MKLKKIIALGAVMAMATGANVLANENTDILVNGQKVQGVASEIDGMCYVPLRNVAETLGFDVEWNGENKSVVLSDLPRYVTMSIGYDGYTLARTAPMPIGGAPVIKDGVTYVPAKLFSDVLEYDVTIADDIVIIDNKLSMIEEVSVTEVGDGTITIDSPERGEVVLTVGDTEITDADGNAVALEEIAVGDVLTVEYGDAMTMSIPPHNTPVTVTKA